MIRLQLSSLPLLILSQLGLHEPAEERIEGAHFLDLHMECNQLAAFYPESNTH